MSRSNAFECLVSDAASSCEPVAMAINIPRTRIACEGSLARKRRENNASCKAQVRIRATKRRGRVGMKAVILAGGMGTRLSEETAVRPKPMVEIGGRPILWHILKIYSSHGI